MKVIIDGVFNHCGSFNKWLDKELIYGGGAYESEDSTYHKWFDFKIFHLKIRIISFYPFLIR